MLAERGYDGPPLNIGSGQDLSIRELAEAVCAEVAAAGGTARGFLLDASDWDAVGVEIGDGAAVWSRSVGCGKCRRTAQVGLPRLSPSLCLGR